MRVGKRHILGPKSDVSLACLVEMILAVAMEIWNHECGPFWPNFAVFAIVCHIGSTISPWGTGSSWEEGAIIVAYDQGWNTIEFEYLLLRLIRSYSTFDAIHDPPLCTACCFLPRPCGHPLGEQ